MPQLYDWLLSSPQPVWGVGVIEAVLPHSSSTHTYMCSRALNAEQMLDQLVHPTNVILEALISRECCNVSQIYFRLGTGDVCVYAWCNITHRLIYIG